MLPAMREGGHVDAVAHACRRVGLPAVIVAVLLVTGCGFGPAPGPRPTPGRLVMTTWVADASVTGGPYPGFRPQLTGITPDMVQSAVAEQDSAAGGQWVVTLTFNAAGKRILSQLSTAAVSACGSAGANECPGGHITMWLDLTQADVDGWDAQAGTLYQQVGHDGKLLMDPYVQSPITGGSLIIAGEFSRQQATTLAARIHA